jgi:tyrosine-protein kinase Etk/Wzc
MQPECPEAIVPELSEGRWLIVADTLASPQTKSKSSWDGAMNFVVAVAENLRFILLFTGTVTLLVLIGACLLPNTYSATTQLLPPQPNASSALLGQFSELASLAGRDMVRTPNAIFIALLRSRTVGERLSERFDLKRIYRARLESQTIDRLEKHTSIEPTKEGSIILSVTDHDPRRAADLANGYVEELIGLNQRLAIGEAARRRTFYESQVKEVGDQLAISEDALQRLQERTGLIQLDTQAKATIEAAAMLRAHIAQKEAELQGIRTYASEQNPDTVRALAELKALKEQLRHVREPGGDAADLPISKIPSTGLEYLRRLRDVKYYEAVLGFLEKQLESARIDEAKEGPLIQLIDRATVPDHKSGPHRFWITVLGGTASFLVALGWVGAKAAVTRARENPEVEARLEQLYARLPCWAPARKRLAKNGHSSHA